MAQTQQYDKLDSTDGSDLANKIGWSTVGNAGATTGNFTLYNSSSKSDSNSIVGAYHKPANAATKTGANIARAWLTAGAGGILSETSVTVAVKHRISSSVNGSNEGWPATGATDIVMGVILRATGTDYATHAWYEIGFSTLTGQSTGTLIIRRVKAGSTTTLTTNGIALPFKYPSYSTATSPSNTPANLWTKFEGTAQNSGGNVVLDGRVTVQTTGGQVTYVGSVTDSSADKITAAGYGGFWTSGNATGSGTAWSHFSDFILTVNSTTTSDPQDPPEAYTGPSIESEATLTPATMTEEEDSSVTPSALSVQPTYILPINIEWETNELLTDAGYVVTQARVGTQRRTMKMTWQNLSDSDSNTLIAFFATLEGGRLSFTWSPPFYASSVRWIYHEGTFTTNVNDIGCRTADAVVTEVFPT